MRGLDLQERQKGEVSRTATTNRTAKLKITLKQTSPFNQTLQVIESTLNAAKFTVTTPNASDVSSSDKAQGILNNVNATVYLSGAVHEIGMNLIITI